MTARIDHARASRYASRALRQFALGAGLALGALLVWHGLLVAFDVPTYEVPTPWTALRAIADHPAEIANHLWVTVQGATLGLAGAIVVAALLALVVARFPGVDAFEVAAPRLVHRAGAEQVTLVERLDVPGVVAIERLGTFHCRYPCCQDRDDPGWYPAIPGPCR